MNLKIGNLLPGQDLTITYTYIEPVSIALNKYWRFINYATLTPRYAPSGTNSLPIETTKPVEGMYKWFITMDIKSSNKTLSSVQSTSHPNAKITFSQNNHSCHVELSQNEFPTKDFVLIYRDDSMYQPDLKIARHSTSKTQL